MAKYSKKFALFFCLLHLPFFNWLHFPQISLNSSRAARELLPNQNINSVSILFNFSASGDKTDHHSFFETLFLDFVIFYSSVKQNALMMQGTNLFKNSIALQCQKASEAPLMISRSYYPIPDFWRVPSHTQAWCTHIIIQFLYSCWPFIWKLMILHT